MRATIAILVCAALTACASSATAPLDIDEVRTALEANLDILATGIEREDPLLASQPVSEKFVMGGNIAVRYRDEEWSGEGIGSFREFFAGVFELHANIGQTLTLRDVELIGDVATARVHNEFVSSRVDRVPPENYTAAGWDWLVFEREAGGWRLISWEEAPAPEPHEMGEGEDI